jgi:peroxiredoxin
MTMPDRPLQPGERAPSFQLPAVNREGVVSLEDYRGKSPVMVGLFKGLHCPFCRRHIARMAKAGEKLADEGIATLAIVATQLERARQYFQYRPTRMELATDPEVQIHRAFGVAEGVILPDTTDPRDLQWPKTTTMAQIMSLSINPNGQLPEKMHLMAASELLNKQDGFEVTGVDMQMAAAHMTQFNSQFLIDASGVIRWSFVEARNSPDELCSSPGEEEMVAAARAVTR